MQCYLHNSDFHYIVRQWQLFKNTMNDNLLIIYDFLDILPSTLAIILHLFLITNIQGKHYCLHFTDEEIVLQYLNNLPQVIELENRSCGYNFCLFDLDI